MFILNNAFIKSANIYIAFYNYHSHFMTFLVIFEISIMISTTISSLISVRRQVHVVLSRSFTSCR